MAAEVIMNESVLSGLLTNNFLMHVVNKRHADPVSITFMHLPPPCVSMISLFSLLLQAFSVYYNDLSKYVGNWWCCICIKTLDSLSVMSL